MLSNQQLGIFGPISNQRIQAGVEFQTNIAITGALSAAAYLSDPGVSVQLTSENVTSNGGDPYFDEVGWYIKNNYPNIDDGSSHVTPVYNGISSFDFIADATLGRNVYNLSAGNAYRIWNNNPVIDVAATEDFTVDVMVKTTSSGNGQGTFVAYSTAALNPLFALRRNNGNYELVLANKTIVLNTSATADVWKALSVSRISNVLYIHADGVLINTDNTFLMQFALSGGKWSAGSYQEPYAAGWDTSLMCRIDRVRFTKGVGRWNSSPHASNFNLYPYFQADFLPGNFTLSGSYAPDGNRSVELVVVAYSDANQSILMNLRRYPLLSEAPTKVDGDQSFIYDAGNPVLWISSADGSQNTLGSSDYSVWGTPVSLLTDLVSGQKFRCTEGYFPHAHEQTVLGDKIALMFGARNVAGQRSAQYFAPQATNIDLVTGSGTQTKPKTQAPRNIASVLGEFTIIVSGYYSGYDDAYFPEVFASNDPIDLTISKDSLPLSLTTYESLHIFGVRGQPLTVNFVDNRGVATTIGTISAVNAPFVVALRYSLSKVTARVNDADFVHIENVSASTFAAGFIGTVNNNSVGGLFEIIAWDTAIGDAAFKQAYNYAHNKWVENTPISFGPLSINHGVVGAPFETNVVLTGGDDSTTLAVAAEMTELLVSEESEIAVPANGVEYTLRGNLPRYETAAAVTLSASKAKFVQRPSRALVRLSMDINERDQDITDSSLLEHQLQPFEGLGPKLCVGDSPFPGTGALVFDQDFTDDRLRLQASPDLNIMSGDYTLQVWVKANHRYGPSMSPVNILRLEPADRENDYRYFGFMLHQPFYYAVYLNPTVDNDDPDSLFTSQGQGLNNHIAEWDFLRLTCQDGMLYFTVNGVLVDSASAPSPQDFPSCVVAVGDEFPDGQLLIKDVEIYPHALSTGAHAVPTFPIFNPDWVPCDEYWPDNILLLSGDYKADNVPVDESVVAQPIVKIGNVVSVASCPIDQGKPYWYFNGTGSALRIDGFQRFDPYDGNIPPVSYDALYVANPYVTLEMEFIPIYDSPVATYNSLGGEDACLIQFGSTLTERAGLYLHYNEENGTYTVFLRYRSAAYEKDTEYPLVVQPNVPIKVRIRFCDGFATFHIDGFTDYPAFPETGYAIDAKYPMPVGDTPTDLFTPIISIGAQLIDASGDVKTTLAVDDPSCFKGYIRNLRLTNTVRHTGEQTLLPVHLPKQGVNQLGMYRNYEVVYYEPFESFEDDFYPRHIHPELRYYNYTGAYYPELTPASLAIFDGDWTVAMSFKLDRPPIFSEDQTYVNSVLFEFAKIEENGTGPALYGWGVMLVMPSYNMPDNWMGQLILYTYNINDEQTHEATDLTGPDGDGLYSPIPVRFLSEEYVQRGYNTLNAYDNNDGQMWVDLTVSCVNNKVFITINGKRVNVGNKYAYDLDLAVQQSGSSALKDMLAANDFNVFNIGSSATLDPIGGNLGGTFEDPSGNNGFKSPDMGMQDFALIKGVYRYSEHASETIRWNLAQRPYGVTVPYSKNYLVDVSRVKTTIGGLTVSEAKRNTTLNTALELDGAVSATIAGGAGSGWTIAAPTDGTNYWPISGQVPGPVANFGLKVDLQLGFYNYDPFFESVQIQLPMNANATPLAARTELLNEAEAPAEFIATYNATPNSFNDPADPAAFKWVTSHQIDDTFRIYDRPSLLVTSAVKEYMAISMNGSAFDSSANFHSHQDNEIDFDVAINMQSGKVVYFAAVQNTPYSPDPTNDFNIYLTHPDFGGKLVITYAGYTAMPYFLLGPDIRATGIRHIRYRNFRGVHELFVDNQVVDRVYCDKRVGSFAYNRQVYPYLFGSPIEEAYGTYHTANFRWCNRAARDNHYAIKPPGPFYNRWYLPDPYYDMVVLNLPLASNAASSGAAQYSDESKYNLSVPLSLQQLDTTTKLFEGPTVKFLASNQEPIEIHTTPGTFKFDKGGFTIELFMGNVDPGLEVGNERVVLACVGYPTDNLTSPDNWWVTVQSVSQEGSPDLALSFYASNYSTTSPLVQIPHFLTGSTVGQYAVVRRAGTFAIELSGQALASADWDGVVCGRNDNYFLVGGSRGPQSSFFEGNMGMVRITKGVTRDTTNLPNKHYSSVRPGGNVYANIFGYDVTFADLVSPVRSTQRRAYITDKTAWRQVMYPVSGWRDYDNLYLGQYGVRMPGTLALATAVSQDDVSAIISASCSQDMAKTNFMIEALVRFDVDQAPGAYVWCSAGNPAFIMLSNPNYDGKLTVHSPYIGTPVPYEANEPFLIGLDLRDNLPHRITLQRNGMLFSLWLDNVLVDSYETDLPFIDDGYLASGIWGGGASWNGCSYDAVPDYCPGATWYLIRNWPYMAPYSGSTLTPITTIDNISTGLPDIHTTLYGNSLYWSAQFLLGFDGVPGTSRASDYSQRTVPTLFGTPIIKATLPSVVNTSANRLGTPMANAGLTSPGGLGLLEFNGLTDSLQVKDPLVYDGQLSVDEDINFTFEYVVNEYAPQGVLWSTAQGLKVQDGMLSHSDALFAPINLYTDTTLYRKFVKWLFRRYNRVLTIYANGVEVTSFTIRAALDFNGLRFGSDQAGANCAYFALDSAAMYNYYGVDDGSQNSSVIGKYCANLDPSYFDLRGPFLVTTFTGAADEFYNEPNTGTRSTDYDYWFNSQDQNLQLFKDGSGHLNAGELSLAADNNASDLEHWRYTVGDVDTADSNNQAQVLDVAMKVILSDLTKEFQIAIYVYNHVRFWLYGLPNSQTLHWSVGQYSEYYNQVGEENVYTNHTGPTTPVADYTDGNRNNGNHVVRMKAIGNTVYLYWDGVLLGSVDIDTLFDQDYSYGYGRLCMSLAADGAGNTLKADTFSARIYPTSEFTA